MSASNRDSEPTRSTPRRERRQRVEISPNAALELLDRSKQYIRDTLDLMSADEVEAILGHDASHPAAKVNVMVEVKRPFERAALGILPPMRLRPAPRRR